MFQLPWTLHSCLNMPYSYPLQTFTFLLLLVLTSKLLPLKTVNVTSSVKLSHFLVQALLVLFPSGPCRHLEQYLHVSTCHCYVGIQTADSSEIWRVP